MRFRLLPPHAGWTPYGWLVYLGFFFLFPFQRPPSAWGWVANAVALSVFLVLYFRGYWLSGRRLLVLAGAIALIGSLMARINPGATVFFIYAAAFLGEVGQPKVALRWLFLLLSLVALQAWWQGWPSPMWIPPLVIGALVGGTNIHYAEARRQDDKLRIAHEAVEEMARVAERERIGRDLHDLLGHTLSLIVLKSELASKLADREPARALQEIRDVERISRDALAEVRSAVAGYRSDRLSDELGNADRVLSAARVSFEADVAPLALPPVVERELAFALREAVTNVVRHARATRCRVSLTAASGRAWLEILDDGRGSDAPEGQGLSGMRERLSSVSGTLERDGRRGMRLRISVPLPVAPRPSEAVVS
jgi:two-component system, NarL family, sensor histidine kinase DesK